MPFNGLNNFCRVLVCIALFLKKLLPPISGNAVPFLQLKGLWLSCSACVLWQILAAPARCACSCAWTWLRDSLGLCLTLCYIVTWKAFPQTSLFSPVPWQPSTDILSWTDRTTRKYFLICRKCPPFFSDYRQQCRFRLAVTHLWYCCLFFLFAEPLFCTYFTHIFLEL